MKTFELWVEGLVGAAISSASNTIAVVIADPSKFNLTTSGGVEHLVCVVAISAVVGAALYLKQRPIPAAGGNK